MSATFPSFLKQRLLQVLGGVVSVAPDPGDKRDRRLIHTARHVLRLHSCSLEELTDRIVEDASQGRVLVVCNRVAQAQGLFKAVRCRVPSATLLHSRFISRDRTAKENDLIAFPQDPDPIRRQIPTAEVLVATQVVEVSLNVSFDTIYTEAAPVDALLQRFGRVNRMNQHGLPVAVHVARSYDADGVGRIYSRQRIETTLSFAPADKPLTWAVEADWVQHTYAGGYAPDEQGKYDDARNAFERVVNKLRPYYTGDDKDFYELFDNFNVVPIRLSAEYRASIAQKRYYEAAGYVVSLSAPTFFQMKEWMEYDHDNHVYYGNRRYDDHFGLLNEPESDVSHCQADIERRIL